MSDQVTSNGSVEAAIRDLIVDGKEIFYGQLITKFKRKLVDNKSKGRFAIPTAAVGIDKNEVVLIVNVDFFEHKCECSKPSFSSKKVEGIETEMHFCDVCGCLETPLTSKNRKAIIKHECQHIAHRHLVRGSVDAGYEPQKANIAMDAVINQFNDGLPLGCIDFRNIDGAKADDTWENYYDLLNKSDDQTCPNCGGSGQDPEDNDSEQNQGQGQGDSQDQDSDGQDQDGQSGGAGDDQDGQDQDGSGAGDAHGQGSGKPCPCCGGTGQTGYGQSIDSHDLWGNDGESNMDVVDATIREQIRKTAESIGIGNLPQEVRHIIEGLSGESKVNWRKALRNWMQESFRRDRFISPFRENINIDGVFPGSSYRQLPEFDVYVDASGSISDEEFGVFMTEVLAINKSLKATVNLHQWDTEVHHSQTIERKVPDLIRAATGGTDVACVRDHAQTNKNRNIIIMTDGYFSTVDFRGFNVLWCYTPNSNQEHVGKKIVLED